MTRTFPALLALVAATATLSVAAPAPARADGGTYAQLTNIFFDAVDDDAPPGRDLESGYVVIDPNLSELEVDAYFARVYARPSFLVLRLGELVSGTCEIRLEVVSNRGDGEPVIRAPGESTLPPAAPRGDDFEHYLLADDPHLVDLVPTCAVMDLIDPDGTVLDTANGEVRNSPIRRGMLRVRYWPDLILNVDSGEEHVIDYFLAQAMGVVYDATLDAIPSDPGLTVETIDRDLGDWGDREFGADYAYPSLTLTATPGLHTLTLRLAGGNAPTSELTVTIWGRGGPALAPRDSLAGRVFVAEERLSSYRSERRVWTSYAFLDDTWARLSSRDTGVRSAPAPYRPCTRVTRSCVRYAFDARTRAFQIGTDRGEVRDGVLRFHRVHDHAARPARAGTTVSFAGRTHFASYAERHGEADFWLTLRKDGTFLRQSQVYKFQTRPTRQRGTYRIGQDGLLVARTDRGKVLRTGLAFLLDEKGRPRPQLFGVYAFDVLFHPVKR